MGRKSTGHVPKDKRGESTLELLPLSAITRISLHPRLMDRYTALGGSNWLKQMLIRDDLEHMAKTQPDMHRFVVGKLMYGTNYADAVFMAERVRPEQLAEAPAVEALGSFQIPTAPRGDSPGRPRGEPAPVSQALALTQEQMERAQAYKPPVAPQGHAHTLPPGIKLAQHYELIGRDDKTYKDLLDRYHQKERDRWAKATEEPQ